MTDRARKCRCSREAARSRRCRRRTRRGRHRPPRKHPGNRDGPDAPSTGRRIREELERKRILCGPREDGYSLLADHVDGPRRTSALKADDVRQVIDTEDETLAHLRIEVSELGYLHIVLGADGASAPWSLAATTPTPWDGLRGELVVAESNSTDPYGRPADHRWGGPPALAHPDRQEDARDDPLSRIAIAAR